MKLYITYKLESKTGYDLDYLYNIKVTYMYINKNLNLEKEYVYETFN